MLIKFYCIIAYKYVSSNIMMFLDEAEWDMKNMQIEKIDQGGK